MPNYVLGWTSGGSVAENTASGSIGFLDLDIGAFPAAIDSIVVTGPGGATYSVDINTFEVTATGGLDYEAATSRPLNILITFVDLSDNGGETLNLSVTDVAEAPDGLVLSANTVDENSTNGTVVGTLTGSDPEGGLLTYALVSGTGFSVVGNELQVSGPLDHEAGGSVNVVISVTDAQNNVTQFTRAVTITDVAEAPDGLVLSANTVDENSANGTVVGTLTGSDPEGGLLTYALVSGTGFSVVGNELQVSGPLDHEAGGSVNVVISVTDAQNNVTQFTRAVTITDVAEAPDGLVLSANTIAENSANGTVVGTLTGSDPEGGLLTYALVSGTGFSVVGNELQVSGPLDHEAGGSVNVVISVTDAQNNVTQFTRAITITDVAEAPDGLVLSANTVAENSTNGTVVGTLTGSDPEGGLLTYALVSGTGFSVVGNELQVSGALDHEAGGSVNVVISVTDAQNNVTQFTRAITITDVAEAPDGLVLSANTIAENSANGTVVGTLTGSDPEGGLLTYALVSGTGFSVVGNELRISGPLDHEAGGSVNVVISVTDAQSNVTQFTRAVTITDVAEAPDGLTLSANTVAENSANGTVVGTLTGSDPEGGLLTYALVSGTGFSVVGNELQVSGPLDHEASGSVNVVISVTDAQNNVTQFTRAITITDVAEAPDGLVLSANTVDENSANGTVVGTLTGSDPEGGLLTYALVSGTGFSVVGNELRVSGPLDHEANGSINVVISATDAQNNVTQFTRSITITDVAEAPDGLVVSANTVAENSANGTVVGTLTGSDPEGGLLSYALVSGAGFSVVGNELRVSGPLDHEANGSVNVIISVTDAQNNVTQFTRAITITDVAEAPDGLALSANTVAENSANGTVVATLTGSDPEGGLLTYALVSGAGFSVVGNELRVSGPLDHEAGGSVNLVISVTDAQNNVTQFTRAITVTDLAEAPDGLVLSANTVPENSANGTVVGTLTGSDPEGGLLTYALVFGAGFSVVGNELRVSGPLDHEAGASVNVVISVTDAQNNVTQFTRAVMITDVAEAPDGLTLSANTVAENSVNGTVVGTLTGSDPEGGLLTYALVSGTGFSVVGNELRVSGPLDHEAGGSVNVVISATDAQSNVTQFTRAITITDVAESPDGLTLSANTVAENSANGTVVGTLTGSDPEGGLLAYALVSGAGFSVVGNELRVSGPLDHEAGGSVNVVISATDAQSNVTQFTRAIAVTDVAEAPDGLTLSANTVAENSANGTVVATLTGADPEGGLLTYALVSGTGFSVVGNELRVTGPLDHEASGSVNVVIAVTDAQSNVTQFTRAVTISDVAELPDGLTLSANSIAENSTNGTVVGTLSGSDPDGGLLTYALVSGAGFSVVSNELRVSGPLDHEANGSVNVVISVTDAQSNVTQFTRAITIADVAEAPDGLVLSANTVAENSASGTVVANLTGNDPEGGALAYALVSGAGFSVVGNELRVSGPLDHEANGSVNVVISVTDAQSHVSQFTRAISVSDVAESPTGLSLSAATVAENAALGTVVATLTGTDPEGGALTYALVSGTGFSVVGNELRVSGALNHEATSIADLVLSVTDAQNHTTSFNRNITISDVNEGPTVLPFGNVTTTSIGETAIAGREVARVTTSDPDVGDNVGLSLMGADAALFVLDGTRVRLANGVTLDHNATPTLHFTVRGTDGGSLHSDQAFTVNVEDVVTQATSLQAVLGGGNGTAVGLTIALGDEGPVLRLGGSAIVLSGQDTLATADGQLSFGASTDLAQVERLYLGLAGRAATGAERMAAADALQNGTAAELAQSLLHGSDFTAYVQANSAALDVDGLSNGDFAELLYNRTLDRASDAPGLNYWTAALDLGAITRADAASFFAVSTEAQSSYSTQTRALWAVDAQAYQVRNLYDVALNREPDAGGLDFWRGVLEQGVSMHAVADYIVSSTEFQSQISGMTTGQVVEMFYQNGLERASETGGHAFWTNELDQGLSSMADVLMGFAQSIEQDGQLASYRNGTDIFV